MQVPQGGFFQTLIHLPAAATPHWVFETLISESTETALVFFHSIPQHHTSICVTSLPSFQGQQAMEERVKEICSFSLNGI